MVEDLGFGYHAIIPDFKDFTDPEQGDLDVGLGIYHLKKHPYRIKLHNVKRTYERSGDGILKVKYKTPKGDTVSYTHLFQYTISSFPLSFAADGSSLPEQPAQRDITIDTITTDAAIFFFILFPP